jgi:hypothetical protein
MGVTVSRRGPKLVFASLLAGGALVASATAALAWAPPYVKVKCDTSKVAITLTDNGGDYAKSNTLDFTGPKGSFTEKYTWNQPENTSETFTYPLTDFPNGAYTVHPAGDSSGKATTSFTVECTKPSPSPSPSPSASPSPSPSPSASASGQGAGSPSPSSAATPNLPNTGFDPNG